jgi:photosystem II stability/assembly factor-like uncharacterized protein
MTIGLSHAGLTALTAAQPTNEVLVGTIDGVVRIERTGSDWRVAERTLPGKHVHVLLHVPEHGLWLAGISHGGIQVSRDDGHTWAPSDAGLTQRDVYSLAAVTRDGRVRLFAGTEPAHFFVSDDLGASWSERPSFREVDMSGWTFPAPPHIAHLKHLNTSPADPDTIYASVEQGALLRSRDGGESWEEVPGMNADVHRTVIPAQDPDRISITGAGGVYVTEDGGDHWDVWVPREDPVGGYPDQMTHLPSDPAVMYVCAGRKTPRWWGKDGDVGTRISRSADGGRTWAPLIDGLTHSVEAFTLEESPLMTQIFAATTGGEVYWSADAGATWEAVVTGLAPVSKGGHHEGITAALSGR